MLLHFSFIILNFSIITVNFSTIIQKYASIVSNYFNNQNNSNEIISYQIPVYLWLYFFLFYQKVNSISCTFFSFFFFFLFALFLLRRIKSFQSYIDIDIDPERYRIGFFRIDNHPIRY